MAILRKEKKERYTIIDNTVFMDYSLSYKAKGLLCQMLSLPDGWEFSIVGLSKLSGDGRDSVASALKELEEANYCRRERVRTGGKFNGVEYVVAEKPFTENPFTGKPNTVNPNTENPPQLNTKESNTDSLNTKESNTKKKAGSKKGNLHSNPSLRPTLEEIQSYIRDKNLNVDGKYFFDYFEAGQWIDVKGNPVRNWKQKLITWSNGNKNENTRTGKQNRAPAQKDFGTFSDFGEISY